MNDLVYIVDDDSDFREEIADSIKEMNFAFKTYSNAGEFLNDFKPEKGRCLLLDERMPGMRGSELIEKINSELPLFPVILVTGFADIALAVKVMKSGAFDFLEKPFSREDLSKVVSRALSHSHNVWSKHQEDAQTWLALKRLTDREREVLDLVVAGNSSKEIGAKLDISPRTVDNHRIHIMTKLNAKSLGDLGRAVTRSNTLFGSEGNLRMRTLEDREQKL